MPILKELIELIPSEGHFMFAINEGALCKSIKMELSSEAIEGPALPLQGIHHIHSGHSLPLGMLGVGHSVTDDILQENLENTPSLFVNETADALDTTPSCKTPDCRLGDALDVVPQHLAMSLGTTLAQA